MPQKFGITNLTAAVIFALHLGNVVDSVTNHGTTIMEKIQGLMGMLPDFLKVPGINFAALSDEVSDLDDAEKAQLMEAIKKEFNIADDKLERSIEGGLAILLKLDGLIKESTALIQEVKTA